MNKFGFSMKHAWSGLCTTWREEQNFRIEVVLVAIVLAVMVILGFSVYEIIPVLMTSFILIASEIMNTVIEDLCNRVEPKYDLIIKKVKDMAAAFVLVVGLGTGVTIFLTFIFHSY